MQLTVLGCDGSWPGPGGACSSYLLQTPTAAVLVDMGTGSLANLQQHMAPRDLDAVILSHEHPDHCSDIHSLDVLLNKGPERRSGLPVYASSGIYEQTFPRWDSGSKFQWTVIENADELEIGDLYFTFSRTVHPPVTHALRVDHGDRTLVYTADTDDTWSMKSLGNNIDLALCEAATLANKEAPGHMNSIQAAQLALDAGASSLMLTHIRPGYDHELMRKEAELVFGGEVLLAETGVSYEI